jgi:hypothetical protein
MPNSRIKFKNTYFISAVFFLIFIVSFLIAISPENKAVQLSDSNGWSLSRGDSSRVGVTNFPVQFSHIRSSVKASEGAQIFRTWTPDRQFVPLDLSSSLFNPTEYMSVQITGRTRTIKGLNQAYIECDVNQQRINIFSGDVNINIAESIVVTPKGWCSGGARIKLIATGVDSNIGIGDIFEVSSLSFLKISFLGLLPYFIVAISFFSFLMFSGASLAIRFDKNFPAVPAALLTLGITSIGIFYLVSFLWVKKISLNYSWISFVFLIILATFFTIWSGCAARKKVLTDLRPYFLVWLVGGLTYFAISSLGYNGLGHWEPNYRFWPAIWSSDNELPWMFAEALRNGSDLRSVFGGVWLPTDRPPLMAGAHLLLFDLFNMLQINNDGAYLRGYAYNVAAIVLNTLWVPVVYWILRTLSPQLSNRSNFLIVMLIACIPFVLFNSSYGWPKSFGAAYALAAYCIVWFSKNNPLAIDRGIAASIFFCLLAFSMLAHASTAMFLLPICLFFAPWMLRTNLKLLFTGAIVGGLLVLSWSLYKSLILPSSEPLIKFALTGNFGFQNTDISIWELLLKKYQELGINQWFSIKKAIAFQLLSPQSIDNSLFQVALNNEFGANVVDKLRAWDFLLISKGNLIVVLLIIISIWFWLRQKALGRSDAPYISLIAISICAWALTILLFFAPVVLIHLPQAAIFGAALGGAVICREKYPHLFHLIFISLITYTGVVWIMSPLHSVLSIDIGSAIFLFGLVASGLVFLLTTSDQ